MGSSHLLEADDLIAQLLEGHSNIFRGIFVWQVPDETFDGVFRFCVEREAGMTLVSQKSLDGFRVDHVFC